MPLQGNPLAAAFSAINKQTITGNGTVGPYTLDYAAGSDQDVEVFVNNVRQEPGVAYTVSGTSMTMTGAVQSSDDFYVVFQGKAQQTATHPSGSALQATSGTFTGDLTVDTNTLYVDSTNNRVGIGTSSPEVKLHISTGGGIVPFASSQIVSESSGNNYIELNGGSTSTTALYFGDSADQDAGGLLYSHINDSLSFRVNAASRMTIDSSGNVGIGTSSPSTTLDVEGANINFASGENGILNVFSNDAAAVDKGGSISLGGNSDSGSLGFAMIKGAKEGTDSGYISFGTRTAAAYSTERMRIESGGAISSYQPSSGGTTHMKFINGASQVGSITSNTVSTFYNTSSDYRLKENVTADWDATTRLKQLNPVRFNFIADADTTVDGFLAHEVQDVVPEVTFGTKDAVDDDGNPVYQGIDQSKLVPLLVKTIQELEARVAALENA